ncbi:MAG: toxin-antitoxin system HicB family antitoxin [Nitrospirota bacterium]|nr:toxin-antitoxin system HicB family antitoxin [Nitrospirota bacterium]
MRSKGREPFKYRIVVRYSKEDGGYIAVVPELRGCSAWGKTESEAIKAIKEAAAAWLEAAKANKIEIPTPIDEKQVTGKFALRMPPELHKELVFEAKTQGRSLNQYIVYKLSRAKT